MRRGIALAVLVVTVTAAAPAQAQIVNVLGRIKEGEEGFGGNLGLSFGFKAGNTNLIQASANLTAGYRSGDHLIYLISEARFGIKQPIDEFSSSSFDSDAVYIARLFEHLRYRYTIFDWLGAEAFAQHEADRFRDLGTRIVVGLGPRVMVSPIEQLTLALGTAYMFEHERYNKSVIESATSHRWSTYAQADFDIDETFSLHNTTFLQPRIAGDAPVIPGGTEAVVSDLRVHSETSLAIKVNDWLSVEVAFRLGYNSNTPPQPQDLIVESDPITGASRSRVIDPSIDFDADGNPLHKTVRKLDTSFDTSFVLTY